ncbi:MAG: hypothetical protein RB294_08975 [Bacteroidales bacterium]|jgi:hypothetical protein|nr:hypothetical protein [Bacteroidales bacterium]
MIRKVLMSACIVLAFEMMSTAQSVGISSTVITPDASSMLDIQATNKGLLIPRVALTATNAAGPVTTPATSLMVYNNATAGTAPNNVTPGYYYWNGTMWVRLLGGKEAWLLTGNNGTNVATNWLGTNDAVDFATRTNNTERMRILSAGNVLVNITTAPLAIAAFTTATSATFTTGVFGIGNGGIPVRGEQQDGQGDVLWAHNTAANGAGAGSAIYASSNQTGGSTIIAGLQSISFYSNAAISAVNGVSTGATSGVVGDVSSADGTAVKALNTAPAGAGVGSAIVAKSNQTGGSTIIAGLQSNAYYPNAAISAVNDVASGATSGVIADVASVDGTALYGINSAGSSNGGGDGVYTETSQRNGFGVITYNNNTNGTGVFGSGNGLGTGYYMTTGSGGAFTGLYDGVYGTAYDSLNNRTSYTQNAAGVYGRARFNRNFNRTTFYHFGVYGEYFDNRNGQNGLRSGGVLGFAQNLGSGNAWGSLGYLSSGGALFGGYFSNANGTGGGKSAIGPSTSIGFGSEGGFMGGHVYGSEYGLVTAGNRAGMLVEGETYSTGYYAVLNQTEKGDYVPSYATVSTKPTIYASGTGTISGGTATVSFDKSFSELASSEAPVIVTITPMGPSQGLYVESVSNTEFVVKENGSNELKAAKGSLNFSWIAMATVKNQENPVVPSELQTNEFHSNMNGFMQNERSTTDQQYYLWWDGSMMRYTEPDVEISFTPAESKGSALKEKKTIEIQEKTLLEKEKMEPVEEKKIMIEQPSKKLGE